MPQEAGGAAGGQGEAAHPQPTAGSPGEQKVGRSLCPHSHSRPGSTKGSQRSCSQNDVSGLTGPLLLQASTKTPHTPLYLHSDKAVEKVYMVTE